MLNKLYYNATDAFEDVYDAIMNNYDTEMNGTRILYNVGIEIVDPLDRNITTSWRKWKSSYAEYEFQWYLSGNPNAEEISKKATIWSTMMDENGNVNSNYGYQWSRSKQIDKVIDLLKKDPTTRRASISIYDGKEIDLYSKDTPCTYAINFHIRDKKLYMQVLMRSNDLVYGFCNDQYCFSSLQELVSEELSLPVGTYYHYAANMHIYERHYQMKPIKNI